MPIYATKCRVCGASGEVFRTVKDYDDMPLCCGQKVERVISPPMVVADIQPYRSMIDGSIISSRSQHRSHLKQNGCVEVGNDVPKDYTPRPLTAPPGLKETLIGVANEKLRG